MGTTKPLTSSNDVQVKFVNNLNSVSIALIIPRMSRTPTFRSTKCWPAFCDSLKLNRSTIIATVSADYDNSLNYVSILSSELESKLELLQNEDSICKEWGKGTQALGKFVNPSMYFNSMTVVGQKCLFP